MDQIFEDLAKAFFESAEKGELINSAESFLKKFKFNSEESRTIFNEESLTKDGEFWKVHDVPAEKVISKMRSGKLIELFEDMGIKEPWVSEKQEFLRTKISASPELHFTELQERLEKKYSNLIKQNEQLHGDIEQLKNMNSELQEKVLKNAEKAGWLKQSLAVLLAGASLALVIDGVINNIKTMKGCWFLKMDDEQVKKYKIINRSKEKQVPYKQNEFEEEFKDKILPCNLNLYIRHAKKNPDGYSQLFNILKISNPKNEDIPGLIKQNFKQLQAYYKNKKVNVVNAFDLLDNSEKDTRNCVACDPSAPVDSVDYLPLTDLATNESCRCVNSVTLWEAFNLFGENAIDDVINDVTKWTGLAGLWSKIGIFLLIAVAIIVAGQFLIARFGGSNSFQKLNINDNGIITTKL